MVQWRDAHLAHLLTNATIPKLITIDLFRRALYTVPSRHRYRTNNKARSSLQKRSRSSGVLDPIGLDEAEQHRASYADDEG